MLEKVELLRNDIQDLRNASYKDIKDVALAEKLVKDTGKVETIKMSSADLIRFVYNTHGKMDGGGEVFYLLDKETICKIVNEIFEEKAVSIREASERMKSNNSMDTVKTAIEIEDLKKHLDVLENELYRMTLAKAIIVPSDDLYRSEAEYEKLREIINNLSLKLRSAEEKSQILEERNNIMRDKIIALEIKLEQTEKINDP